MTFNAKMLRDVCPKFSSIKCHYFYIDNGIKSYFVKKIISKEKLWDDYFCNEIKFYKLYQNFKFHKFNLPNFVYGNEVEGIIALEFIEGSALSNNRFVSDEVLTFSQIDKIWSIMEEISRAEFYGTEVESKSEIAKKMINSLERIYLINLGLIELKENLVNFILHEEFELGFSHGDFLLRNIIEAKDTMYVFDWEFFGQRVVGYDLAMLWVQLVKKPKLQSYVYEKIQNRPDWKMVDILIIVLLEKEIRIHRKDELKADVQMLSECLREFQNSIIFKWKKNEI